MPAAVSTTDVGNPAVSQNINPIVYSISPCVPFAEMELSVLIMEVRNFSRSKNVEREMTNVSQFRREKRMVMESIAMAVVDRRILFDFCCWCDVGVNVLDCLLDAAPPLS
jgi:hypothetical protein